MAIYSEIRDGITALFFYSFVSFQPAYLSSPPLSSSILQPGRVRIGLKQLQQLRSKLGSLVRTSSFPLSPSLSGHVFYWFPDIAEMKHAKYATWPHSALEVATPVVGTVSLAHQKATDDLWTQGLDKQAQAALLSSSPGADLERYPPPPDLLPVPGA